MAAPCLDVDDPDLENDDYKTHFNRDEKFGSEWLPRHSGFARHGRPAKRMRGQSSGDGAS
jgi:hypothetical protein